MPQNPNLFEITQSIKPKMRHANRNSSFRLGKRCRGFIISPFGTVPSKYQVLTVLKNVPTEDMILLMMVGARHVIAGMEIIRITMI